MSSWYRLSFTFLLASFVFYGCNTRIPQDIPDIGIPEQEVNSRMSVWVYGAGNNIVVKNNEPIIMGVDVKSPNHIEFSYDYGVRLFLYNDEKWVEIENAMTYDESVRKEIILPLEGLNRYGSAGLVPYYPNLKKSMPLRIVLIGRLVDDGEVSEEKTAGYIDVTLKP
jgi:hypothetical protein